jgi:aryl sulfotransferase
VTDRRPEPVRYRSPDEDSARWLAFTFRPGDIVISTRSKSGTTWMQMICLLLVMQRPELPAPLAELSPWLDWLVVPIDDVLARLDAQEHRRVIKTHTPLDGVPIDPRATYIVVARHPLDMAVSLYHQGDNINREPRERPALHEWLLEWVEHDADPRAEMDSLSGVMWHLSDAWSKREEANVVLVHYDDLQRDLEGGMRGLASRLRIEVNDAAWPELVGAASFDGMRARADQLAPDAGNVLKDRQRFFRRGSSGEGRDVLSSAEMNRYEARVSALAPDDLVAWLHMRR